MKHLQFKGPAPADATTAPQLKHQADTLTAEAFQLTDEQQAAVDGVLAFCNQSTGGNFASLNGPAGAGKSTTSRHLRQALIEQGFSVGLCAPTHKACGVLAKACGVDKADTATFASLLGLREVTKKDERDFIPMPGSKPRLSENDVWLADEASMMHPKLLGYIENATDFWNRIVFNRKSLPK